MATNNTLHTEINQNETNQNETNQNESNQSDLEQFSTKHTNYARLIIDYKQLQRREIDFAKDIKLGYGIKAYPDNKNLFGKWTATIQGQCIQESPYEDGM